ncbi:MAG: amidohydrolase family protein [Meiothermus sp.]|uniref:amidohydrolase family protein n=1 Tax=Meiothermus sp. TaxID=1955249 RepID=UPI00298F1026|nr:amidohydrolase family protein [Meiothermus sp.]MDW8424517.1 amidohydrolase family protein [Meiothermus sp.]
MLKGGLVVVGQHIAASGPLDELRQRYPEAPIVHKGKALTPPVVNAHTHLDLSTVPYFRGPYTEFIQHVIDHRMKRTPEAAQQGLEALRALGVGGFGDIAYQPEVVEWLLEHCALPGVVYLEVINRNPTEAEGIASWVARRLSEWRGRNSQLRVGISPHTPYNVSPALLKKLVEIARLEGFPLQMHVAESPEETELMTQGRGPLQALPERYGFPPYQALPGLTPVRYLAELGVLGPHLTVVHGVQVDEEEVEMLAQSGTLVVACPRSNEALACGQMPWDWYLKHRLEPALGTDSQSSSPDLDVRNEALFLWGRVDPRVLVRAATRSGYRVLGLETPRITRGTPVSQVQSW